MAELLTIQLHGFFSGSIPYRAIDLGTYHSPIFEIGPYSMYGATAHVLEELLELYALVADLSMPQPESQTTSPGHEPALLPHIHRGCS